MNRLPLLAFFAVTLACAKSETPQPQTAPGDAERGRALVAQYGCNVCHVVPGIEGPQGSLGPALAGLASRPAISFNSVPNTPANLARFIENPGAVNPQSTMPPIGILPGEAQDITAYLLTLK